MKLIVNTDVNWGIGKNNSLLFTNKEDMKFFRETTTGGAVVMGRRTLESFPGAKPLKNRVNIVMTHSRSYSPDGVTVCHTRNELAAALNALEADGISTDNIYLIGGASMYNEFMDCCSEAYVTRTFAEGNADSFINNIDERGGWHVSEESELKVCPDGTRFRFVRYINDNVRAI